MPNEPQHRDPPKIVATARRDRLQRSGRSRFDLTEEELARSTKTAMRLAGTRQRNQSQVTAKDPWTDPDPQPGDFDADLDRARPDQTEIREGDPDAKLSIVMESLGSPKRGLLDLTEWETDQTTIGGQVQDLMERLESAREGVGIDRSDVARVLETSPRTVSRWMHRQTAPRPEHRERLLEILYVFDQLSRVLKPEAAHDWLFAPNEMLNHEKPIDLLAAGEYRRVLGVVEALAEGVFV